MDQRQHREIREATTRHGGTGNACYGEANNPIFAGVVDLLAGIARFGVGLVLAPGGGRFAAPWVFGNLDLNVPAVFQAVRNLIPGLVEAIGGGVMR